MTREDIIAKIEVESRQWYIVIITGAVMGCYTNRLADSYGWQRVIVSGNSEIPRRIGVRIVIA